MREARAGHSICKIAISRLSIENINASAPSRERIWGKTKDMAQEVRLNGVRYRWPKRPVVVVCVDGGDPAYFDRALKDGIVPNVARFLPPA